MIPAVCEQQLARLSVLRGIPEDVVEYFAALEDVPDDLFTRAVTHAVKTRQWFPTPAELRADCDAVNEASVGLLEPKVEELVGGGREVEFKNPLGGPSLHLRITRDWKFNCDVCRDTGWKPHACPAEPCGRRFQHAAHEWVTRCECVPTNPTIQRHRAATSKFAQPPEKVGS